MTFIPASISNLDTNTSTKISTNRLRNTDGSATEAYTYDAAGNVISNADRSISAITYDSRNLARRILRMGSRVHTYGYDHQGVRITKDFEDTNPIAYPPPPPVNTRYVYGAYGELIAQYTGETPQFRTITTGTGETLGRMNTADDTRYYYLKDHLGSVRVTLINNGNIAGADDFYPFGLQMPSRSYNQANEFDDRKFTGHFLEQEGGLGIYHAGARLYDPEVPRFYGVDAMRSKYPGLSSYVYAANNPVIFIDPDGNDIWFVHGTFSDPDTWERESIPVYEGAFNDQRAEGGQFEWSGGNTHGERVNAAESLATSIMETYEEGMEVNIVGHSHGGNVAIMAANILAENDIQVDNLITIGTPERSEYSLNEGAVGNHVNIFSQSDPVQVLGGFDTRANPATVTNRGDIRPSSVSFVGQGGFAGRTQQGATNFNATSFAPNPVTSHSAMHNNLELIRGLRLFLK